ncbi:YggS family pyridoxal phosphate-dependent enzyme [Sutterella sp.]|uniref:YggS family pyridoxal phosphate-dependent enzyme n=1 Tax=Sutterella sp. TaxID=1981025 RepID=UPI0026DFDD00|nr:YggS family pyridoxal phosphate-dependent enzyme [Sutterella sp.]MDO5531947.1 YggS family pyridoxal phosphate-dependent enzyme [Sutterella sp.]
MTELEPGLPGRYAHVCAALEAAEAKAGREKGSVKLLAVGKTFNAEAVLECARAGARAFGENYAQEGCDKVDWFREHHPELGLEWHFIGPLQSNKTRPVAERFDWVQSIDRLKIAERLSAQRPAGMAPINLLIEVNIDGEDTKSGVTPAELPALAEAIEALPNVRLRGLMAIPAPADDHEARMKPLLAMRTLFAEFRKAHPQADTLSMGMSADLEEAVLAGTTMVRVGSAIFGARNYNR